MKGERRDRRTMSINEDSPAKEHKSLPISELTEEDIEHMRAEEF